MANEPSLSELTYTPNPATAPGDRVGVSDNSQGIQNLIGAAQQKAHYDQVKYQDYQNRLGEAFKNLQVDYADINPNHKPELQKLAGDFYSELSKNANVLANPQSNPDAYANIMSKYSNLKGAVSQSKQQYAYATAQDKYMYDHPELLTDENKNVTKTLYSQPLGQFNPLELQLPDVLDYTSVGKGLNDLVKKERPYQEKVMIDENGQQVYTGNVVKGNETYYDKPEFEIKARETFLANPSTGKYNQKLQSLNQRLFDKIDPTLKNHYEQLAFLKSKELGRKVTPEEEFAVHSLETGYNSGVTRGDEKQFKDESYYSPKDRREDDIKQQNANTNRGRLAMQSSYTKWKMQNPTAATNVEQIYDTYTKNISDAPVTIMETIEMRDKEGNVGRVEKTNKKLGDFDYVTASDLPPAYKYVAGVATNDKGKVIVDKLSPFKTSDGKEIFKVKYFDPANGDLITENSEFIKKKYAEVKKTGYNKDIRQFIRDAAKLKLINSEFEGKNGTANKASMAESIRAINALATGKGEENVYGSSIINDGGEYISEEGKRTSQ